MQLWYFIISYEYPERRIMTHTVRIDCVRHLHCDVIVIERYTIRCFGPIHMTVQRLTGSLGVNRT